MSLGPGSGDSRNAGAESSKPGHRLRHTEVQGIRDKDQHKGWQATSNKGAGGGKGVEGGGGRGRDRASLPPPGIRDSSGR